MKRIMQILGVLCLLLMPIRIQAEDAIDPITFSQEHYEMQQYSSIQLRYEITGLSEAAVHTFTSSDPSVVSVSESGMMNALSSGEASVTLSVVDEGVTYTKSVSVRVLSVSYDIEFANSEIYLQKGAAYSLNYTVSDSAVNQPITWSSSNPSIASVENGQVRGHLPGKVTITARVGEAVDTIIVNVVVPLEKLSFNPDSLILEIDSTEELPPFIYVPYDSSSFNQPVFTVDDPEIVTLDGNTIYAKSIGQTKIRAVLDGVEAVLDVTVEQKRREDGTVILPFHVESSADQQIILSVDTQDVSSDEKVFLEVLEEDLQPLLSEYDDVDILLVLDSLDLKQIESIYIPQAITAQFKDKTIRIHLLDGTNEPLIVYYFENAASNALNLRFTLSEVSTMDAFYDRIDGQAYRLRFASDTVFPENTYVELSAKLINSTYDQLHFVYPVNQSMALAAEVEETSVANNDRVRFAVEGTDYVITFNKVSHANNETVVYVLLFSVIVVAGCVGIIYWKRLKKSKKV